MQFLSERHVKAARKAHVCDECGHPIPVGEPYTSWSCMYEGEFQTGEAHAECIAWANAVLNHDDGRAFLCDADPADEWEDEFIPAVRVNPPSELMRTRLPARWLTAVDRILVGREG